MLDSLQVGDPLGLSGISGRSPTSSSVLTPTMNLLKWTEAMDNAVWTKIAVTVAPNTVASPSPPGDGSLVADTCSFVGANRFLRQTTAIAAATGSNSASFTPTVGVWNQFTATAPFDTGTLTLTTFVIGISGAGGLKLNLTVLGGFVDCNLQSTNSLVVGVWGWQLETGAVFTTYAPRTV
jgi:hypothetical protein